MNKDNTLCYFDRKAETLLYWADLGLVEVAVPEVSVQTCSAYIIVFIVCREIEVTLKSDSSHDKSSSGSNHDRTRWHQHERVR